MTETLAERVERLRMDRKLSKQALEQKAGLPGGYASLIAQGKRKNLQPKMARRLAEAFGVTVDYILHGDEKADGARAQRTLVRPTLAQIEGYADAEIEAARREPQIPVAVFREARDLSLGNPPERVTAEFLLDIVRVLHKHRFSEETEDVKRRVSKKRDKSA